MPMEQVHTAFARPFDQLDVVVIDDAKPMQQILRSLLHSFRVGRTRIFESAPEAMQSMLMDTPNLLIIDWHMNPIDGLSLLKALRAKRMGALALAPAIIISSQPTRRMVESSVAAGAHSVLAKPLSPAVLQKRIESITHDPRPFILDNDETIWMLSGNDRILEANRNRWLKYSAARNGYRLADDPMRKAKAAKPKPKVDDLAAPIPMIAGTEAKKAKGSPGLGGRNGNGVRAKVSGFANRRVMPDKTTNRSAEAGQTGVQTA